MAQLLTKQEVPEWFVYPRQFLRIIEQNLLNFDPWIILDGERLRGHYAGLKERYPYRDIVPFARREDNDDIMCWDKNKPNKVVVIHDFASEGYEYVGEFESFWDWLRAAIEATIGYDE
ncbi:hypothetical protein ID850_19725 [Xenorhabdus sp. Flor]|uniref:hypothetical protein n=1 Tax=Xenorhabdus cabanillasii TaxID=351673 RepID=UPI0019B27791|nr:hypothetical protein [Xenorhabdus sp. Flor]MBD2816894.1 hypothetical protein [Xenorhabdus sp. Flor]